MKKLTHACAVWFACVALALLAAGCAMQKEPATKAVASVEATLSSIRDDAAKYAAPQLQEAETALASLKSSLDKKDYKGVLAAAPGVTSQVAQLQSEVAAKRKEAEAAMAAAGEQWRALSADVPNMLTAIQSRVDMLGQSKRLPKNLTADAVQSAKSGLEFMQTNWTQAQQAFSAGNPVDAVAKANAVKDKGTEVMKLLNMS